MTPTRTQIPNLLSIGVLLVIALQNGLNVIGVDAFWQDIVFGLLVITAIILNADKSGRDIVINNVDTPAVPPVRAHGHKERHSPCAPSPS
ncbi:MAG: hypothetical protein LIQ31_08835 [Planctomycetes bacterium]|nr:hypothetical protein [Planctomycetota bacterium]